MRSSEVLPTHDAMIVDIVVQALKAKSSIVRTVIRTCTVCLSTAQRLAAHPRCPATAEPRPRQPRYGATRQRATIGATPGRAGYTSLLAGGKLDFFARLEL
jgi:hypothetical protein